MQEKPFKGTIKRAVQEEMRDGARRVVVYFEGRQRGLVLNGSRYNAICQIAKSRNSDDWIGADVVVTAGKTNFGGKQVDCMELRAPSAKKSAEQRKREVLEALDDDLPDNMKGDVDEDADF